MKRLPTALAFVAAIILGACADPLERRSTDEVSSQLERGVSGQGTIGPEQRQADDRAAEHGIPETHP